MQVTSELYDELVAQPEHWFEVALSIGESGRLIEEHGYILKFGDTAILVDSGDAETAFREDMIMSITTTHRVFNEDFPVVGSAVAGEIDISMKKLAGDIPKRARLAPYVRVTDGMRYSEWLPKGVYFVDTRETTKNGNGLDILTIHGYDAMLMFEVNYPSDSSHTYPLVDTEIVRFLVDSIGIEADPRTYERMDQQYMFPLPVGYSSREVLEIIAASYAGNFVISDTGMLLLIRLADLPRETNHLVTEYGDTIVFGSDKILV